MIERIFFCFLLLMYLGMSSVYAISSAAKLTVKVVDEEDQAVEGATVGVGFNYNTGLGTNSTGQQGTSDADGKFSAEGQGNGHVSYGADKEGYYNSHYVYDFHTLGTLGWEPKNPELTVFLRKIGNPVPMYVRDSKFSTIEIPVMNKEVGFDLEKFDWVAPYGAGVYSDFIFHVEKSVVDWKNFDETLTISFSNKDDGIQKVYENLQYGSKFKLPRYAPESGYESSLVLHEWRTPKDGRVQRNFDFVNKELSYVFRARSTNDGEVVNALYGKIVGKIDFSGIRSNTAKIYFRYYLNPDGTRNLEFDPRQNLFKNLPVREQVREP